jgi:hypothetical protein
MDDRIVTYSHLGLTKLAILRLWGVESGVAGKS